MSSIIPPQPPGTRRRGVLAGRGPDRRGRARARGAGDVHARRRRQPQHLPRRAEPGDLGSPPGRDGGGEAARVHEGRAHLRSRQSTDATSPNNRVGSSGGAPTFALNENGTNSTPLVINGSDSVTGGAVDRARRRSPAAISGSARPATSVARSSATSTGSTTPNAPSPSARGARTTSGSRSRSSSTRRRRAAPAPTSRSSPTSSTAASPRWRAGCRRRPARRSGPLLALRHPL